MDKPNIIHTEKPWGNMDQYVLNELCSAEIVEVGYWGSFGIRTNNHANQLFVMLDGDLEFFIERIKICPEPDAAVWVPLGSRYCISHEGDGQQKLSRVLAITFGSYFTRQVNYIKGLVKNQVCSVKILRVAPGASLSYQMHNRRSETWYALESGLIVRLDDAIIRPAIHDCIQIPLGAKHSLAADSSNHGLARIIEVSLGHFDENDIVRLEDVYGRADGVANK